MPNNQVIQIPSKNIYNINFSPIISNKISGIEYVERTHTIVSKSDQDVYSVTHEINIPTWEDGSYYEEEYISQQTYKNKNDQSDNMFVVGAIIGYDKRFDSDSIVIPRLHKNKRIFINSTSDIKLSRRVKVNYRNASSARGLYDVTQYSGGEIKEYPEGVYPLNKEIENKNPRTKNYYFTSEMTKGDMEWYGSQDVPKPEEEYIKIPRDYMVTADVEKILNNQNIPRNVYTSAIRSLKFTENDIVLYTFAAMNAFPVNGSGWQLQNVKGEINCNINMGSITSIEDYYGDWLINYSVVSGVQGALYTYAVETIFDSGENPPEGMVIDIAVTSITVTAHGSSVELEITENNKLYGNRNENIVDFDSNELVQATNKPTVTAQYQKIQNDWQNGKQTMTINCPIVDYYDTVGNKVIDITSNKMIFEINDIVEPYTFSNKGDIPISYNNDFTPKRFKVVGTKITKEQGGMQELTLQEV